MKPSTASASQLNRAAPWLTALLLVLAAAIGVAWLQDWGRLGPDFARPFAAAQSLAWVGSLAMALLMLWAREPLGLALVRGASRWAAWPASRRVAVGLACALLLLAVVAWLHWAHKLHRVPGLPHGLSGWAHVASVQLVAWGWQPVTPSLTSEMLRWPACIVLAWLVYRAAHGRLSALAQASWALAVLTVMVLGLLLSRDKGPILVATVALMCLIAAVWRHRMAASGQSPALTFVTTVMLLVLGLGAILTALPALAPADRLEAWRQPYQARLEYLAEITWFVQAAGWLGFGLGKTPWCGYSGAVTDRCIGMPPQTQSDYTLAALAGLWGTPAAWCIAAVVAGALLGMIWLAGRVRRSRGGVDVASLAATVGGLYALLLLAQWAITVLGNVGLIPLTGVSLPFVSWGRASLLSLGLALGLVWPAISFKAGLPSGLAPLYQLWRHVAWVAMVFSAIVLLALPFGMYRLYTATAPDRTSHGRLNPWLPLVACLRSAEGHRLDGAGGPCDATVAEERPSLPEDQRLRTALGQLARAQPLDTPLDWRGLSIPRRQPVQLTLQARLQSRADQVVACLTDAAASDVADCASMLPPSLRESFDARYEGVAARSVSMVTLRLDDGAILAAAHARSRCSEMQMAGQAPESHCPPTAAREIARRGRQAHQAFHAHDMVSSTIKPLLAGDLISQPAGGRPVSQAEVRHALVSSDSSYFIDQLLCWGSQASTSCPRLERLQRLADAMRLGDPMPLWQAPGGGPEMVLAGLPVKVPMWPPRGSDSTEAREWKAAQACSNRPAELRWRGCAGEHLAATLAPLWGQGEVRSHPVAVAALYLRLAAAAQGATSAPAPHLWAGHAPAPLPVGFAPEAARLILDALRDVPLRGTAASACRSVLGANGCTGRGWAMKTGTSLFPHHTLTAAERARRCKSVHAAGGPVREEVACAVYPMKWAVLTEDASLSTARLTVVVAERNYSAVTGLVDSGDDRAPNVAAQAALLLHAEAR
jgi:cell division protein FtsW (lipid II flippase)